MAAVKRCTLFAAASMPFSVLSLNGPPQLHQIGSDGEVQLVRAAQPANRYYKQQMTNYVDLQYWGDLDVGNQVIQGILDTGSYELLICSIDCKGCGDAAVYQRGETAEVLGHEGLHFYGSGSTYSQMVTDAVGVTGAPSSIGLYKEDQYLWETLAANMPVIREGNFQAIVGLGPPEVADDYARSDAEYAEAHLSEETAAKANAKADELATQPTMLESYDVTAFSVCLLRPYEAPGYLIWNDEDTRASSSSLFSYVKISGTRTWGARVEDVTAGGTLLGCGSGCGAILDSGTSLVMTDPDTWKSMYQYLLDQQSAGVLEKDCSNLDVLPDLVFQMGEGVEYRLPPQSYVGTISGVAPPALATFFPAVDAGGEWTLCELLLAPIWSTTDDGPLWILGMPFFREYYTTFDLGENPRDPKSRGMYTAHAGDECFPTTAEQASTSTMVQSQRKTVRTVDLSKVRIPDWALEANRTGHFKM